MNVLAIRYVSQCNQCERLADFVVFGDSNFTDQDWRQGASAELESFGWREVGEHHDIRSQFSGICERCPN